MTTFFQFAIPGIPFGCVYALVAVGLVLIYKTSGVFNLAFGAQAYVSSVIFYVLVKEHHWSLPAAFVIAVLVTGPLFGFVLDRGLFRHMRTASSTVKLVSSLGLLIGIPPVVEFFWPGDHFNPPSLSPNPTHVYRAGSYYISGQQVMVIAVTVIAVLVLAALFRYTPIGLKMRAVVESPRMVQLAGINADRVGMFAWMLSSLLTALAGVLLAPIYNTVDPSNFTALLVAAAAAAVFGGMYSLPLALVGGLLLGMSQQILTGYLPLNSILATGLRPAFPFVVLVVLLLFWPPLRRRSREVRDPLAGCDPPQVAPVVTASKGTLGWLNRISFPASAVIFSLVALLLVPEQWQYILTEVVVYAIVFLSINMLTGLSGQLSLCQFAFAGIGCFTAGQLVLHYNLPILLALPIGAAVAAVAGALVAIPALRLEGLYLALATLAFALMADNVLFPQTWMGNGETGLSIPRPQIGSINFTSNRSFFVLSLVVLVICGLVFGLVKRGTVGRFLAAMRGSEVAASSIGINPARAKITIFALSAAIAGIGGIVYGSLVQQVSPTDFNFEFSLLFVVLVLTTGSRTVEGAANAAFGFIMIQQIFGIFHAPWVQQVPAFLFGFGALGYAKHPEGLGDFQKQRILAHIARFIDRVKPRRRVQLEPAVAGLAVGGAADDVAPAPPPPVPASAAVGVTSIPSAALQAAGSEANGQADLLEAENVSKRFGGIEALKEISLRVGGTESVGLVGPNGAGKTTLFNCLLGMTKPDTGSVTFEGRDLSHLPVHRRARLGISRTFQRVELFAEMTPREHFVVAGRARAANGYLLKDLLHLSEPTPREVDKAQEVIDLVGISAVADQPVETLSLGHCRLVELGRALVSEPELMLLDEPSSGLDASESGVLADTLTRVCHDRGIAVLLVEHDLEMVQRVVSRLYVLDFGMMIANGPTDEVLADAGVRAAYLGQPAS